LVNEKSNYVPERMDIVWIDLDPQSGHEQAGRRPAVVISPSAYNAVSKLCLLCPITKVEKGYPFEVRIKSSRRIQGVALADQLKSCDWVSRKAEKAGVMDRVSFEEILAKIKTLMFMD
jgi:mRNA interferase MazF